jgi:hemoglobin
VLRCLAFDALKDSTIRLPAGEDVATLPFDNQQTLVHELGEPSPTPLLTRIGGRRTVERVIDRLYDHIESDPDVRAVFPANLDAGRAKQKLFFEQWLGGEPRYSNLYGSPRLRQRHLPFSIDDHRAERWLHHMTAAMRDCGVDSGVASEIYEALQPLARHFINQPDRPLNASGGDTSTPPHV